MTFIAELREDLCRIEPETAGEALYEMHGAMLCTGAAVHTRHTIIARHLLSVCRRYPEVFGKSTLSQSGADYIVTVEKDITVAEPETQEHAAALLKGAFLVRGAATRPDKDVQANIVVPGDEQAGEIVRALAAFEVHCGVSTQRGKKNVYIRGRENVAEFVGHIGAGSTYLMMENAFVMKDMRTEIQRQVNCDNANIGRTEKSSARQREWIERIENFASLPDSLIEVANLRLEYPYATLEEIGNMCREPVSKNTVNLRMRRLIAIAKKQAEAK